MHILDVHHSSRRSGLTIRRLRNSDLKVPITGRASENRKRRSGAPHRAELAIATRAVFAGMQAVEAREDAARPIELLKVRSSWHDLALTK